MLTNDEVTACMFKCQAFWNKWKKVDFSKEYNADELLADEIALITSISPNGCFDGRKKLADFFIDEIIMRQQRAGGRK